MDNKQYFSWVIIDDRTAVKICDKSFFEHKGSAIPKQLKTFFDINNMSHNDGSIKILLNYKNKEYDGRIEFDPYNRSRIFWHSDLSVLFKKYYKKDIKEFPSIRFYKKDKYNFEVEFLDNELIEEEKETPYVTIIPGKEGKKVTIYSTKYERNPKNRKLAVKIHGTKCMICGFDFEKTYGEAGRNFVEVHHIKPLYEDGIETTINPEKDLVCVCSNCHRIIHRCRNKVYSIDEVIKMIQDNKKE